MRFASILFCLPVFAQSFEVVSIKAAEPSPANQIRMRQSSDPGMVHYGNHALRDLIRIAYRLKDFQVEGPQWIDSARFDVTGKLPAGATEQQVPEMLQSMLADRFKLVAHRDNKDHAIFALVAAKGGPKLKAAENPVADGAPRGRMSMEVDDSGAHLKAASVTLSSLSEMISRFSERPIIDMSGIQGQYDFDLVLSPEALQAARGGGAETAPSHGTVQDAVEKYGLKLEPRKAAMDTLVIDHIEKVPTEN